MESRKRKRGFTLIEVMLVLMILTGLAALAVFAFGGREERAKTQMTTARMDKLLGYLNEYKLAVGTYPEDDDGLDALVNEPDFDDDATSEKWLKLAESQELKDHWGNDIRYELVEVDGKNKPRLKSNGPDGEEESDDDIIRPVEDDDRR